MVASVVDRRGMLDELRRVDTIESRARIENLDELMSVAHENAGTVGAGLPGLLRSLEQVALISEADNVPGGQGEPVC